MVPVWTRTTLLVAWMILAAARLAGPACAGNDFARRATWELPNRQEIRARLEQWLEEGTLAAELRARVLARWDRARGSEGGGDLLDLIVDCAAEVDERAAALRRVIGGEFDPALLVDSTWLDSAETPAWMRANLSLALARRMVHWRQYEQADSLLRALDPEDVVDPAALLFYRGLASHQLLQREEGVESLARLLEHENSIPRRFASLARSMVAGLQNLREGTLDHISRQMGDIERRLSLGHGGPAVRKVEDDVVAALDKLIKELEDQQFQQAQSMASSSSGGNRSSQPAPDSLPLGGKGEGRVTQKELGDGEGWGMLDPRQREEILQQIGRDLPAHLRDVIQQYFRKLAETRNHP